MSICPVRTRESSAVIVFYSRYRLLSPDLSAIRYQVTRVSYDSEKNNISNLAPSMFRTSNTMFDTFG
jgi:ribosomal protein S12